LQNLEGLHFGPFHMERLLGHGGFAAVYRARDITTAELCTVKLLASEYARNPELRRLFDREAHIALQLRHPNLPVAVRSDQAYGRPYIVFRYEDGIALETFMKHDDPPQASNLVEALIGIARAIDYLHSQSLLHRDIKPGNILITALGSSKLLDFGLALHVSERKALRDTAEAGTPAYLAPELSRGGLPSVASDVYAFGVTIKAVLRRFPSLRASVGDSLAVIESATDNTPARRPRKALDLLAGLPKETDLA
jgi:serine/threonine protein kinase, bacterial